MGFYIRKSVKAGPFRFNLSKSGLGVSAGVPGFRVGTGPRGNYVHMGRGGLYYRATLSPKNPQPAHNAPSQHRTPEYRPSGIVMEDVTGATVVAMAPTGGGDVVEQLNAVAGRFPVGWAAAAAALVFGLLFGMPWAFLVWLLLAPLCAWLVLWDQARHKVVLFYDVHDESAQWFDKVVEQWAWLTGSQSMWRVIQSGVVTTTHQFKTNSGAGNVINRVNAAASTQGPPQLATNIAIPSITAGKTALYFLPDRVLVRDGKRFSDVTYAQLGAYPGTTRFIETSVVPRDAVQVDWTWRFVNVKGGPDRRYNNNHQIPVMLYETMDFTSSQGLQWRLQVSRKGAAPPIASVIKASPSAVPAKPAATLKPLTPQPKNPTPQKRTAPPADRPRASQPVPVTTPTRNAAPTVRSGGLVHALLTRTPTAHTAGAETYTAIDIETTGLDPDTDQIVEIGLVKFTADGTVVDEFATMVNNPGSSSDARAIHGIADADLDGAPTTAQVLIEAFAFMSGTVVVAHNLGFEDGFLTASARRAGVSMPTLAGVCTLQASRRQLDGRAFSLTVMYKTATGGWIDRQHNALADARAVKDVLLWFLRTAPQPLYLTEVLPAGSRPRFEPCPIRCRPVPLTRSSVAELLDSFPQSPIPRVGDPTAIERYETVLAEAVEDGRLSFEEAETLTNQASRTQLTGTQLRALHRQAWSSAFHDQNDSDWTTLTPTRRREMYLLAEALGLDDLAEKVNDAITACTEPTPPPEARYLRGLRVAIVGDDGESHDLRKYAEAYGAKLAVNVTKTVAWLASAAPDAADSRHQTARRLGIPVVSPHEGRTRLDESIREAELKAFERQRQIDEYAAVRRQREADGDAYWRPTWRRQELDHDPQPDYDG